MHVPNPGLTEALIRGAHEEFHLGAFLDAYLPEA